MKRITGLLLLSSLVIMACDNDKSKDNSAVSTKQKSADPAQVKDAGEGLQKIKEDLENLTPLTHDELKALIPAELMGTASANLNVDDAMGSTAATADYKINDSTGLKIEIVDCGGAGGSGYFTLHYLNMINVPSDDDDETRKTIDWNGGKAFENCKKKDNKCTLTYLSGNRFLVSLAGENVGIGALKDLAKGLKIK